MRWIFLCLVFIYSVKSIASDSLTLPYKRILSDIAAAQEQGYIMHSLRLCKSVMEKPVFSSLSLENQWDFLGYNLDGYNLLNDHAGYKKAYLIANGYLEKYRQSTEITTDAKFYAKVFFIVNYAKAKAFLNSNKPDSAIQVYNELIKHVNKFPERYWSDSLNNAPDSKHKRLLQLNTAIGAANMSKKDYAKAYHYYLQSMTQGKLLDSLVIQYNIPGENCKEESCLYRLANYAKQVNNQKLYNQFAEQIIKFKPQKIFTNSFQNSRNQQFYLDQLRESNTFDEARLVINNLQRLETYNTDLQLVQELAFCFLRYDKLDDALKEINKYKYLLDQKTPGLNHSILTGIMEADYLLKKKDITTYRTKMDGLSVNVEKWSASTLQNLGASAEYLTILNRYISNLYNGFQLTGDAKLLKYIQDQSFQVISIIYIMRNDLEAGQSTSLLLKEYNQLIDHCLNAFYILDKLNNTINWDAVLNLFEINKSNQLLTEKFIRHSIQDQKILAEYTNNQKQIAQLANTLSKDGNTTISIHTQYASLINRQHDIISNLKKDWMKLLSIKEVQNQLKPNEVLMEYLMRDSAVYVLIVEKNNKHLKKIENIKRITKNIHDFREAIKSYYLMRPEERDSMWSAASHSLYANLLQPFHSIVAGKHITIITDGLLSLIPFNALLVSNPDQLGYRQWEYTLKTYHMCTQYSIRLWNELNHTSMADQKTLKFYVVAPELPDLKNNVLEADALTDLLSASQKNSTKMNSFQFLQLTDKADVLHISSHAYSLPNDNSYIILGKDSLLSYQIANFSFPQELVFLSACETGTGQVDNTEGVFSLARSFFQAGAKSIVSTFWPVNDKVSKDLVIRLYQQFLKGAFKDEALRNMQLAYLSDKSVPDKYLHPYYWAGFQINGNLSPMTGLRKKNIFEKNKLLVTGTILAVLAYFIWNNRSKFRLSK